ncbi:putative diguanylate cyclase YdaM [Pseudodesulfovibrio hydrargyri]|uniref:diguanylate cyclase n=1 Tax=Pseudodesulfovibrio hydrargyri TaxID=2125990 RepID=A0A1J5N514_9BACT|nr:sensor domain-containing diguanylate cyclase [Pseudodesulfovibrio hydrargyri]OIQ49936.1 putative diguanylate cyclase YdaM [Pseudodesulfovibrio hydrargyri]
MLVIELDIRTLSIITVVFSLGFGSGLVAFGAARPILSGLKQVGFGMLSIGLAFLLIGLRHRIPQAWSLVVANSVLVLGFMLMNRGIQGFREIPRSDTWPTAAVVVFNTLSLLYFSYVEPSFTQRVFWVCLSLSALSGICCRNVIRRGTINTMMPQKVLALGFGLFGAFMLLRALWALDEHALQDFMAAGTIHQLAFLAMIMLLVTVAFGLIWLASEYLFQELKQYERIILTSPEGIVLVDADGRYRMANDASLKFVGLHREELLGKRSLDLYGKEFYETVTLPNIRKAFAGETSATSSWVDHPDGGKVYLTITYYPVPDTRGRNSFVAIHIKNMTELHFAQKEKQRIFDLSLDMLSVIGMDGVLREVNPSWTGTLGWSQAELLHSNWADYVHPEDAPKTRETEDALKRGEPVVDFVNRLRTKDGLYRHIAWMASPDVENRLIYCVARDVTNRVSREEELFVMSTVDPLTGAHNRRFFMEKLDEEVERGQRYGTPLSLLAIDIDHFKKVNDTYGHSVGDKVLQRCVDTCKQTLRSSDTFGRLGGEEFMAILPFADHGTGHDTAERLRLALSRCTHGGKDGLPPFTVSIGVVQLERDDTADSLLKRADEALYRAKENGRNRVERG